MMRTFFLNLFILTTAVAQITMPDCRLAAQQFGSQTSIPTKIPKACANLLISKKSHTNFDQSSDQLIEVYGHENILLTKIFVINELGEKTLQSEHFTAGEKTMLDEIISVKINSADKKAYVLNKNNDNYNLLSYFYQNGGNNVPARKLITDELRAAHHFTIDNQAQEFFIISKDEVWIKVFNRDADPDGPREKNSVKIKRTIHGDKTQLSSPIDLVVDKDQLFILDNNRVLVFDKNTNGNTPPLEIISDKQIELAQKIEIKNNQLIIHTQSNESFSYALNK